MDSAGRKGFRLYMDADTPSNDAYIWTHCCSAPYKVDGDGIPRWYPNLEEELRDHQSVSPFANLEAGDADPNCGDTGKSNGERRYFWARLEIGAWSTRAHVHILFWDADSTLRFVTILI